MEKCVSITKIEQTFIVSERRFNLLSNILLLFNEYEKKLQVPVVALSLLLEYIIFPSLFFVLLFCSNEVHIY